MAQIRKFSSGGSPEASTTQNSPKKPYKLTIDGKTFDLDDDDIYRWSQSQSSNLSAVGGQAFQDVVNAIKRGVNVHYNSATNTFTGVNFSNKDIVDQLNANRTNPNQKQAQKQLKNWAKRAYRKGDIRQDWMVDTANFMKYNFAQPTQKTEETTPELISLYNSNGRTWDYNTNDDGTVSYSNGPQNAGNMAAIDNFIEMLGMSNEDAAKRYNWTNYDTQVSDLRSWHNQNQNYDWEGLKTRIRENRLDSNDWDLLSWMGFTQGNESTSKPKTTARSYEGSGFNDDILEQSGYYVRKDQDGNTYLLTASTDSEGNVTYTPVTQNMYLIGDNPLVKGTQWENGALYNGRFYTPDQIFNQNTEVTAALSPLFDQLRATSDPEQARQILANSGWNVYGVQNPLTTETYTAGKSYLRGFNDLLNNGTYYVTDISNQYNLPETSNLIAFFDPNNRNQDGTFRASYAINHDGASQIFDNQEALQNYLSSLNITSYEGYNPRQSLGVYDMITENGKRYIKMPNQITVGSGSNARQHNIYRDEEGNYYTEGLNGMIRLRGEEILEAIKNGTVTEQQLKDGFIPLSKESQKGTGFFNRLMYGRYNRGVGQPTVTPGSYDSYFKFYKEGGKISVLQVGGLISKGKIFDGTNDTEARKVGEATKAFGASKELKTDADKWAKAAGFLDTGGAALSFIPGVGNIAGAATGIAGSIARFTADTKRDGLDWGDARRLITNLGLDVLTLIPGAGAAAKAAKVGKTAKAAKTLQKTGKVLQATAKPLSVAGTIGGASAVIGAVADGDGEFTSEDFAQLGQGILGMTGGLKNIKQLNKEARLVKELAGKIKTPDLKETKELKWYKKPGAWISNRFNSGKSGTSNNVSAWLLAYNPAKQEQMLAEVVKKGDIDLKKLATDKSGNIDQKHLDDLKNVLGRYLSTNNKTLKTNNEILKGQRINPWFTKSNQFDLITKKRPYSFEKRSENIVNNILTGKFKSADELTDYIIKNIPEAKQQQMLDLLTNRTELQNLVSKISSSAGFATPELVIKAIPTWLKQGGKIIKGQYGLKPGDLIFNNTNTNPYFDYERTGIVFDKNGNVDWINTYKQGSTYDNYRNFYINNWNQDWFQNTKNAYLNQLSQGNSNKDFSNLSLDEFKRITSDQNLGYAHNLYIDPDSLPEGHQLDQGLVHNLPEVAVTANQTTSTVDMSKYANPQIIEETIEEDIPQYIDPNSKVSGQRGAEYTPKLRGWNPDDLIGGIELARSLAMNTAMFNRMKDANKLIQKEMPTEIYDRYQDHITPIFNEQARNKRQFFVSTSTDALTNYAMRQTNEDAARQLEMEGKLRASEAYSQYLDKDLAARRAYAEDRRNAAFFNRQEMANKLMRDAQIDMQRKLANNQSIQNAVMEFRNKLNQDWNRRQNFMQQEDAIKGAQAYDAAIKKYLADNGYNAQWNALGDDEKRTYGDIQNWLSQTNYSAWNDMMTNAGNARIDYMRGTYNNYLQYPWSRIRYAKKGTKTPTYQQRHNGPKPDEAIWIQRNKDTAKAIEKLHDAVIKLFMKSIS